MDIKNIENLLVPKLGDDKKIMNVEVKNVSLKGAGSTMLKVTVTVQDENNKEELLHLVAKKIAPSHMARAMFDTQNTFKKEVNFYEVVIPILKEFQKDEGVNVILDNFPEFYGARYSLEEKTGIVDDDAVILDIK